MGFVRSRLSTVVVALVVVALVAATTAMTGASPAATVAARQVVAPTAVVSSQRLAVGSPEEPSGERLELVERRSASSSTFRLPDGNLETAVSAGPVHFQDSKGDWQDIDSSLAATDEGWRNGANSFVIGLPSRLGEPVTVNGAGTELRVAVTAGPGVAPQDATGTLREATVRYPLGRDLTVAYKAIPGGLKESLELASPAAARAVGFDVAVSDGGRLVATVDGGADVVGRDGQPAMHIPAPFAVDAAGEEGPARLTVKPLGSSFQLTLSGDDGWLDAPGRAWPVVIDPTVMVQGTTGSTDCYISSANPTGQDCASDFLRAGNESGATRNALLKFPNLNSVVPYDAVVMNAKLRACQVVCVRGVVTGG